jgi:hypothetical protein
LAQVIAAILAIAKSLPVLDKWIGMLVTEYARIKKLKIEKETIEAVDAAFETHDQRGLESEEHSGQYSGVGTIRDSLPGVLHKQTKDKQ